MMRRVLGLASAALLFILTVFTTKNIEKLLEVTKLDAVLVSISPGIINVLTNPYFQPGVSFVAGVVATLIIRRFWNSKAPLEGQTSAVLTMRVNVFGFLVKSPSNKGTYKLYLNLKALETVGVTRITVLFNRPGGNGSYQLAAYALPRQMHLGEELDLVLIHYRPNIGTFWGDLDRVTESMSLDQLNQEERDHRLKRSLHADGPYYCQLVVQHTQGEERLNFTVLVPSGSDRPGVLTSLDHKDYDPNRLNPAKGTFLS